MTNQEFEHLLARLSAAWIALDSEAAVGCFEPNAIYLEPPNRQHVQGHPELRAYFDGLVRGVEFASRLGRLGERVRCCATFAKDRGTTTECPS